MVEWSVQQSVMVMMMGMMMGMVMVMMMGMVMVMYVEVVICRSMDHIHIENTDIYIKKVDDPVVVFHNTHHIVDTLIDPYTRVNSLHN